MERLDVTPAEAGVQSRKRHWIPAFAGMTAIVLFTSITRAESPETLFQQANAAYANGELTQAVSLYETAQSQGLQNWALFYNLGNAYYKTNQLGKAVASYLRAFRLNSRQRDVVYNLNLALKRAGDPLVPEETLGGLFWRLFYLPTVNELTLLSSLLFLGACLAGIGFLLGKWRPAGEPAFAALALLAILGFWCGLRAVFAERREAVVIVGVAEVRSAPNFQTPASITIPEGRRLLLLEDHEPIKGWVQIGVPQEGLKGWLPESSIETVP